MDFFSDYPALVGGLMAAFVAVLAWWGDWRRMTRHDPDRVGIMPWTTVFMWAMLFAVLLLAVAGQDWLARG